MGLEMAGNPTFRSSTSYGNEGGISVSITGIDDLKRVMAELPAQLKKKYILAALRKAARVPLQEARRVIPVMSSANAAKAPFRTPGLLKKRLSVRVSKASKTAGNIGVFVNIKPAAKAKYDRGGRLTKASQQGAKSRIDPYYWKFVNFGTKKMPASRFLEKAADALPKALDVFKSEITPIIQWWNNRK